jgi:hypothetical protein
MADETPHIYVEPPVPVTTEFATVDQVRHVLNQHDAGRFRMSALLYERMLWNSRFSSVMRTRLSGFVSAQVTFDPVRNNRDARRAAREFAEDWPAMVTTPVRKQYRRWALGLGVAFGQRALELSPTSGRQIFRLRPYWAGFCNWYWAEGGYRIQTYDAGVVDTASPGLKDVGAPSPTMTGLINPSQQPWVIDEPNGANSWREGIIHAAWRPWLGHEWSSRDQARASEKHGIGAIKAKYPRGEGDQHKAAVQKYNDGLRTMGSEGVIPCEQREDGPGFDAEPFEFNGSGFQAISDTMNANAVALAILLLGHNLTTEIKGGGSYAAAGVGEYIRDDIKHDDAACEWAVFGPQLARPYCMVNYGDPDLAPIARYITDSTAQNRAIAQMFQAIAQAIQLLRVNVPSFDVDAFCERWRIPLLAKGAVQVPPPPANQSPTPAAAKEETEQDEDEKEAA